MSEPTHRTFQLLAVQEASEAQSRRNDRLSRACRTQYARLMIRQFCSPPGSLDDQAIAK